MSSQQNILSFILADHNNPLKWNDLVNAILKTCQVVEQHSVIPYYFFETAEGLHSFALSKDLEFLEKSDAISINGTIQIKNKKKILDYAYKLNYDIQKNLKEALAKSLSPMAKLPYITSQPPRKTTKSNNTLYTTGYEGTTIDSFFKKLVNIGIEQLIDVRKNPISRKFGFSKKILSATCTTVGLSYKHYPELGIPSENRQELHSQSDYTKLFTTYERDILPKNEDAVRSIINDARAQTSVLLCYEADSTQCHRSSLAKHISKLTEPTTETPGHNERKEKNTHNGKIIPRNI